MAETMLEIASNAGDPEAVRKRDLVVYWAKELEYARKREKSFKKEGHKLVALYEGAKKVEHQFNILYSNTETLAPAVYNSTPRPVVKRRFKDDDPMGAIASKAGQRVLEYLLDDGMTEYSTFDELMRAATLEALVPGRGLTSFRYESTIEKVQSKQAAEQAETPDENGKSHEEGETPDSAAEAAAYDKVTFETVCGEEAPWDRFLHGYARKWKDVPWIAYEIPMSKEELEENFGEIAHRVPVDALKAEDSEGEGEDSERKDEMAGAKAAIVYKIWDKATRKVYFICETFLEGPLKEVDDPLKLPGFFDCPKPLGFMAKISSLAPVALYAQYEEQAKELNAVTLRINKIVRALKVRGFYDQTIEGLASLLTADDNTMLPIDNAAAIYAQAGGRGSLEKVLFLVPIEKLVTVLQQLYIQRNQIKQVIYEITGIADIMRGSSVASETLGAQELKNQWGTLRLKRFQKEVARYARDSLRLMLEIAVHKLSPETLRGMTGMQVPLAAEKQQAQMQMQQLMMQMPPQMPGQPSQLPPEAQKLQAVLAQPAWEEVIGLLQNDLQRSYRIDIETNSTVDAEATEDKQDIAEVLNAISQFLSGIGPLIQQGIMPFDAAQAMLLAIVRRYRFGDDLEEQIKQMKPPQGGDPGKDVEMQKAKLELQGKQMEAQQREREMQMEMEFKKAEHGLKMAALQRKEQMDQAKHQRQLQMMAAQAAMPKPVAGNSPGNTQQ